MFKVLDQQVSQTQVEIFINDKAYRVNPGIGVAAALLQQDIKANRQSLVSHAPRGPYCMMGVCFECLVEINGQTNQQACLTLVTAGMHIRCQNQTSIMPQSKERFAHAYDATLKEQDNVD